jgi:hypothetical protein
MPVYLRELRTDSNFVLQCAAGVVAMASAAGILPCRCTDG